MECSGRISAVGEKISTWKVGDEVCALLSGGGYADAVTVPANQVLPVPRGLSLPEAAALPEAACTVWLNIFTLGRLQPGGTLLVHGGSGGIGTMAIQVARSYGADVFSTASAAKAERLLAYGAKRVIDYRSEDFVTVVNEHTEDSGVDVVLDHVAGDYLDRDLRCLATDGRIVVIGAQAGRRAKLDISLLLSKRASILGSTLRGKSNGEKAGIASDVLEHIWPLIENGMVKPAIDRAFAMADAGEAHAYFDEGSHVGKVLLVR
jgi:putative PIG3 family NAD(P)H quinone oxidoreductase